MRSFQPISRSSPSPISAKGSEFATILYGPCRKNLIGIHLQREKKRHAEGRTRVHPHG